MKLATQVASSVLMRDITSARSLRNQERDLHFLMTPILGPSVGMIWAFYTQSAEGNAGMKPGA
jgi:hypothetical protein